GPGTITGTVTFKIDGTAQTPATLVNNSGLFTATFSTSTLIGGAHTIDATYNGDTNFAGSSATQLSQTVNQVAVGVVFATIPSSITAGSPFAITVDVVDALGNVVA